jgi:hypothetical protein
MAAEIVGIEKILKYISKEKFNKITLTCKSDTSYNKRCDENFTQEDLIEDFKEYVEDFIEDDNFKDYKLELRNYDADSKTKYSPVVKVVVAFHHRNAATTAGAFVRRENNTSSNMDVEKYIAVATENATLKAQIDRLEEKMDELIADEDEEDEVGDPAPATFTEAINGALIGKIDTIVDVILGFLAKQNTPAAASHSFAINGVQQTDDLLVEFRKIHPEIDEDIVRFYKLATEQPQFFTMVIGQLRKMV